MKSPIGFRSLSNAGALFTCKTRLYNEGARKDAMIRERVRRFLDEFTRWASVQEDIRAAALVGSYARDAATEISDVDLVILADRPEKYLEDTEWLRRFGTVQRQQVEDYGLLTSIRVWYSDGLEVEYGLTGQRWAAHPLDAGTRRVMADGMRILFERGGLLSQHQDEL